jgi:hypothetical protein
MNPRLMSRDAADLRRLQTAKTEVREPGRGHPAALGPELLGYYKDVVQKRQTRLAAIAEKWVVLVPDALCDHCVLQSFTRGSLTVLVDSSSHLYELNQLLLGGLQEQLLLACRSTGLRKITLRAGQAENGDGRFTNTGQR